MVNGAKLAIAGTLVVVAASLFVGAEARERHMGGGTANANSDATVTRSKPTWDKSTRTLSRTTTRTFSDGSSTTYTTHATPSGEGMAHVTVDYTTRAGKSGTVMKDVAMPSRN